VSTRPDARTFVRDTIIFGVGVWITVGQTGLPYLVEPPPAGPNVWSLLVGALFCNGPVVLQALALRFGSSTSGSAPSQVPQAPGSPSAPSSVPSSGGD
jgi:hypothetical protein